jgi:hypothetical protein
MKDRFRIVAEVDHDHLGTALATLHRAGIQATHELIGGSAPARKPAAVRQVATARRAFQGTSSQLVEAFMSSRDTFTTKEMAEIFKSEGRNPASVYPVLNAMMNAGTIKKMGTGQYKKATKGAKPPAAQKRTTNEVTNADFLWGKVKGRKHFKVSEATAWFKEDGRNPVSVSPLMAKMVAAKRIRSAGDGIYEVVKAKPKTAPKPSGHKNGNGAKDHHSEGKTHHPAPDFVA